MYLHIQIVRNVSNYTKIAIWYRAKQAKNVELDCFNVLVTRF